MEKTEQEITIVNQIAIKIGIPLTIRKDADSIQGQIIKVDKEMVEVIQPSKNVGNRKQLFAPVKFHFEIKGSKEIVELDPYTIEIVQ